MKAKKEIKLTGINNIFNLKKRKTRIEKYRKKARNKKIEETPKEIKMILTIDLSKKKPGFCIGTSTGQIKECFSLPGVTKTKPIEIQECIKDLIKRFKPDIIILEEAFQRFKNAAAVLYLYQGIVYGLLLEMKKECYVLPNRVAKAQLKAKTKEKTFEEVCKLINKQFDFDKYNDEIDAIALYYAFLKLGMKSVKKIN